MSTQPDDEAPTVYPDRWRRRTKQETLDDQVVDYLSKLSHTELHILLKRARGDR